MLYEKFGEFDSAAELNEAIENQIHEGDLKAAEDICRENGIDVENLNDYQTQYIDEPCTILEAALGKIEVEAAVLPNYDIFEDWTGYIKLLAQEDEKIAINIRKKGKSLAGCLAELLKWGFSHQYEVPKSVLSAAKINANKVTMGIPGMKNAKKIIKEYYME